MCDPLPTLSAVSQVSVLTGNFQPELGPEGECRCTIGEIIGYHDNPLHQQVTVTGDGSRHSTDSPVSRLLNPLLPEHN